MTTIAWDGVMLAADKQLTEGDRACGRVTKIGWLDRDRMWAISGEAAASMQCLHWLREAGGTPPPTPWPEKAEVYVIHRSGNVYLYESTASPIEMDQGPFAAGSGGPVAHGAMLAGADAYVAVALASTVDIYTGGGIDTLRFEPVADE